MTDVSNRFALSLRDKISKKINLLPLTYFDNHAIGDTLSRVTNDVDTLSQNLSQSLSQIVTSVITLSFSKKLFGTSFSICPSKLPSSS